jgi:hypothetical protein
MAGCKVWIGALLGTLLIAGTTVAEPLRVHETNPRYFTDDTGKAIYLTGSHIWSTIHSWPWDHPNWNPSMNDKEFDAYLRWLKSHGHNFTRLWTNWSYVGLAPYPWSRTGTGKAVDGGTKFNMLDFNPDYFALLRKRIQQIEDHGMYASVMFFGSHNLFKKNFKQVAWHEANNSNPELAKAFTDNGYSFFTTDPEAIEIQRALVRKTIDTLNEFDNIIFEVINEPGGRTPAQVQWHKAMIDYTKQYEAKNYPNRRHLIGMTGGWYLGEKAMLTSHADWISPDWAAYREGGPARFTAKIIIADTDHLLRPYSVDTTIDVHAWRRWVWKTFMRGHHPILMDLYDSYLPNDYGTGRIEPRYNPIRDAMGKTLEFANRFADLARMVPSDSQSSKKFCSTNYCLADEGREYLVYQPFSKTSFTVNLPAGEYNFEWYCAYPFGLKGSGVVKSTGGSKPFKAPFSGDAVLYLKARS